MKIAVIGANGKTGRLIVNEAISRSIDVSAIVRAENKTDATHVISKDLFDLTYDDLKAFDVIVDAFGVWDPEKLVQHSTSLTHLSDILSGKKNRLIVVGGAGSLFADESETVLLKDTPDFPDMFKPLANAMSEGLDVLRGRDDVQWTYMSPAADFVADGVRTGQYQSGGDVVLLNKLGESMISYADYAIALVDEIEQDKHRHQRITVCSV